LDPSSWQNIANSQGNLEMVFPVTEVSKNYFRLAKP
jgi:hypothetical protein